MNTQSYIAGKIYTCLADCEDYYNKIEGSTRKSSNMFALQIRFMESPMDTYKVILWKYNYIFNHPKIRDTYAAKRIMDLYSEMAEISRDKLTKCDTWDFILGQCDMKNEIRDFIKKNTKTEN